MAGSVDLLSSLAKAALGELSDLELQLLQGVATGHTLAPHHAAIGDVSKGDAWGADRTVRASLLRWLCFDRMAVEQIGPSGICAIGVKVAGELGLSLAVVRFPITLRSCFFSEGIDISGGSLHSVDFAGSVCKWVNGGFVHVDRSISLGPGFQSADGVLLVGAQIGDNFIASGARLSGRSKPALVLDGARVGGRVMLDNGFRSDGPVTAVAATVGGDFVCLGGRFFNRGGFALALDEARIRGRVLLNDGFRALGVVRLRGATIGRDVFCRRAVLMNPGGDALDADSLECQRDVILNRALAIGPVSLCGAQIKGDLRLSGASFFGNREPEPARDGSHIVHPATNFALAAQAIHVGGVGSLDHCRISGGAVSLTESVFKKSLSLVGSKFVGRDGLALAADGIQVGGSLRLDEVSTDGQVLLQGAKISGDLSSGGAEFLGSGADGIFWAQGVHVGRAALFDKGFKASGSLRLTWAEIGGDLTFDHAELQWIEAIHCHVGGDLEVADVVFVGERKSGLTMPSGSIRGKLQWQRVTCADHTVLDLAFTQVGRLLDEAGSWPTPGNLRLQGFTYSGIAGGPRDAKTRLEWLGRLPVPPFFGQPYTQLARVMTDEGDALGARQVRISRERAYHKHALRGFWARMRHRFLGLTVGYGYRPFRALLWAAGVVVLGTALFGWAFNHNVMTPAHSAGPVSTPPRIGTPPAALRTPVTAFFYSLDTFVPILDLYQKSNWQPDLGSRAELLCVRAGVVVLGWVFVEKILGWVLTTLFVAAISGVVRRE